MTSLKKIYDLHDDMNLVAQVQSATQTTLEFGLVPEHGIFASRAWWDAIADGRIETHIAEGLIGRVYMDSVNEWPEFELNEGNTRSTWSRLSTTPDGSAAYVVGRRVRLHYVFQKPRTTRLTDSLKIPISVWVEEA